MYNNGCVRASSIYSVEHIMSVGYVALYALCHNNPVMSLKKSKQ